MINARKTATRVLVAAAVVGGVVSGCDRTTPGTVAMTTESGYSTSSSTTSRPTTSTPRTSSPGTSTPRTSSQAPPAPGDAAAVTCRDYEGLDPASQTALVEEILSGRSSVMGPGDAEIAKSLADAVCTFYRPPRSATSCWANHRPSSLPDMAETYESLTVDVDSGVARVTLTGPGKGNAMGPAFWTELPQAFTALDADADVRAIVLTGSGRNFSYGLDLTAMGGTLAPVLAEGAMARPRSEFLARLKQMQGSITAVADCRTPVIASVHGWCIGGGVDLISAVDIRYASADAKFSVREVKLAMVADVGSLARLPLILSEGHLRELALTGKDIDAERASRIGLVNDVYPDADASLAAAHATAREIAANPPLVVAGIKDVLDERRVAQVTSSLRYVAAWNSAFMPSKDLTEGVTAMFEKRAPEFTGE